MEELLLAAGTPYEMHAVGSIGGSARVYSVVGPTATRRRSWAGR